MEQDLGNRLVSERFFSLSTSSFFSTFLETGWRVSNIFKVSSLIIQGEAVGKE